LRDRGPNGLTLVIGGARSGKSAHAERLIAELAPPWTYIATAQAFDDEMRERIALHQRRRDERWRTVEAPLDLVAALAGTEPGAPVLVDCLTLWLSNHMLAEHDLDAECRRLEQELAWPKGRWVVVSNEVGMGIVPENALARRFRDQAGRLNQRIAGIADRVVLMVAGIPMQVK
jgi:adenosylcobinamide kinase / adenosylcobinamide-phosphate guanylyltransferase